MGELHAALDETLAGQGRLVMLVGEPGIGKTRTTRELAGYAEKAEVQVLWGWCYEEAGAPPYWPWVQPLRSLITRLDSKQLRSLMGPGAADIAEIIPEVREKLPGLGPPPALEPEQARFRLFDSITTFLKNSSQAQPMMLVLDDLHWADRPSLLLLQFLARQMANSRLLVVGCYRDVELSRQHPLSEALAQLVREPVFQRKPLPGLSREYTGDFITAMTGLTATPGLVQAIHARAEGNPFFMLEVVRLLGEQGAFSEGGSEATASITIPQGVREAIGQRLNRLSRECNQVLTVASVLGREFSLEQLGRLSENLSDERLLEVVEEALAARIIEDTPDSLSSYSFCHALIQETLLSELSTARRVRLHARIAEALEELYGADMSGHAAELAYHFGEAEPVLGADKLVRYSLLAGARALATFAWEEALEHFQRGLAAEEGQSGPIASQWGKDAERAALFFGLGRAQLATLARHQIGDGLISLTYALNHYARAGDAAGVVAVAEYPLPVVVGQLAGAAQLISQALALVPPDSHEAGRLLSRYIGIVGTEEGDYQRAEQAFDQALAIAQRERDALLELRVLVNGANVDFYHLRLEQSIQKNLRAIEVAQQVDDPLAELDAQFYAAGALMRIGEAKRAQRHALATLSLADRMGHRHYLIRALARAEEVAYHEGDWRAVRDFNDRALEVAPHDTGPLALRVTFESQIGDLGQSEAYMVRYLEALSLTPSGPTTSYARASMVIPFVARMVPLIDRSDMAQEWAEAILSSPSAPPMLTVWARIGLALLAVERGDVAAARTHYAALKPTRGTISSGTTANDRLLGLLAQTTGDLNQAKGHFEDALTFCRKAGCRPELAWTCHDYAETLLRRNRAGDRVRATSLLDESLTIASELVMRPLMEKVLVLRGQVEMLPSKTPSYPNGLTEREVEVLRLVAVGKSNAEIGQELFISANTVAHHITNILNKTNSANRTEAATYATRHGLM